MEVTKFFKMARPLRWLFSGWNCTALSAPRLTFAAKSPP